jgi:TP901 family phage tail tape measure protein
MPEDVGSLRIRLGLDNATFQQQMSSLNRELQTLGLSMREQATRADGFGRSLEGLQSRANLLSNQLTVQNQRLSALNAEYQQAVTRTGAYSEESQRLQQRIITTQTAINRLETQLQSTNAAIVTQTSSWNHLSTTLQNVHNVAGTVGAKLADVGKTMTKYISLPLATAGVGLVKTAADFEEGMSKVKAVSTATSDEIKKFENAAKSAEVAKLGYTAKEAAGGLEELVKAGVSTSDILNNGLTGALTLARAGEVELAEAAETASTVLNSFRKDSLDMVQVSNLLAGGANASATDVKGLSQALSQSSAVAAGVGLSFKDTTTALSLFAQNGLKGSDSGTSLKTMLSRLVPTTKEAREEMMKFGLATESGKSAFFDAEGKIKSFADIAELLKTKLGKLTNEQRLATLSTIFGSDAVRGANIAFNEGATGANKMSEAIKSISASDTASEKMNNLNGELKVLKANVLLAAIELGNALLPIIKQLTPVLLDLTKSFASQSPEMKKIVLAIAAVVAAIPPVILVIGQLITGVSAIAGAFSSVSLAIAEAGGIVAAITTPVGIAIAAIAALIAIGVLLYQNWDTVKAAALQLYAELQPTWEYIKTTITTAIKGVLDYAKPAWENIKNTITAAIQSIVDFAKPQIDKLQAFWKENGEQITAILKAAWEILLNMYEQYFKNLISAFSIAFEVIKVTVSVLWNAIKLVFSVALDAIMGIVGVWLKIFKGDWAGAWEVVKQTFSNIWINIKTFLGAQLAIIGGLAAGAWEAMKNKVIEFMINVGKAVLDGWKSTETFFKELPGNMIKFGENIIQGLIDGIKNMLGALMNVAASVANSVKSTIQGALGIHSPSKIMMEIGGYTIDGLTDGMDAKRAQVAQTMQNISTDIKLSGSAGGGVSGNKINITVGNVVGTNGMKEFANIISQKINGQYSLSTGGGGY